MLQNGVYTFPAGDKYSSVRTSGVTAISSTVGGGLYGLVLTIPPVQQVGKSITLYQDPANAQGTKFVLGATGLYQIYIIHVAGVQNVETSVCKNVTSVTGAADPNVVLDVIPVGNNIGINKTTATSPVFKANAGDFIMLLTNQSTLSTHYDDVFLVNCSRIG